MVSKQYTRLAMLMPLAMIIGTFISIYAYKYSQQGPSIVIAVGIVILLPLLFYSYRTSKGKKAL